MEPGLLLAARSPENVVARLGDDLFVADGAGGLSTHLGHWISRAAPQDGLGHLLDGLVVDAEGVEGPEVLVEHPGLGTAREVVGALADLVAAANGGSGLLTFGALELGAPLDLLLYVRVEESLDALVIFAPLLETRGEEEAVVVGAELPVGVELAIEQLIILLLVAENTNLCDILLCHCWQLLQKRV